MFVRKIKFPLKLVTLILATSTFFLSCKKDEMPTPLSSYNMSAVANGETVTYNTTGSNYHDTAVGFSGTWVTNVGETYRLQTVGYIKVNKGFIGNYTLNSNNQVEYAGAQTENATSLDFVYYANNGTFSITQYDSINQTISGTFNFSATGSANNSSNYTAYNGVTVVNVTKGVFTKIKLTP